ncbi:MAG: ATP synthase F1 subunit gamma [Candidatus Hydrogenedentes bacterium]|nr:ATP synthase F1 subunit gamma [Candidatus Hydrogenedentota bacterium]
MANIQYLKKKLETIKNVQKLTRAIKMVATVRAKKAQQVLQTSKVIPQKIREAMYILKNCEEIYDINQHPLVKQREKILHSTILIVSNDHGLCGSFASRVAIKALELMSATKSEKEYFLISIGNRGTAYLKSKGVKIDQEYQNFFSKYTLDKVYNLADFFVNSYLSFNTDEVMIVYTSLKPSYNLETTISRLVPISIQEVSQIKGEEKFRMTWVLEPDIESILNEILKLYLVSELNKIFHESFASEQIARMQAMEMASTNAEKFLSKLKIEFNKIRQELITKEVIEVISGSIHSE